MNLVRKYLGTHFVLVLIGVAVVINLLAFALKGDVASGVIGVVGVMLWIIYWREQRPNSDR